MVAPTKRFAYKAVAVDGQPIEGEMDAVDESAVIDNLQTSGYLPVSANELTGNTLERDFNFLSNATNFKNIWYVLDNLYQMSSSAAINNIILQRNRKNTVISRVLL